MMITTKTYFGFPDLNPEMMIRIPEDPGALSLREWKIRYPFGDLRSVAFACLFLGFLTLNSQGTDVFIMVIHVYCYCLLTIKGLTAADLGSQGPAPGEAQRKPAWLGAATALAANGPLA